MQSKATSVQQYLAELLPDRREAIQAVRAVFLKHLDKNIREGMSYGMIGYAVPHSVFPAGYHCDPKQPLPYAGLASQKQAMSLYLMCAYGHAEIEREIREGFKKAGKKLDMGKACIRFKKVDDLALDVIASVLRRVTAKEYIAYYQAVLDTRAKAKTPAKAAATKAGKTVKRKASVQAARR